MPLKDIVFEKYTVYFNSKTNDWNEISSKNSTLDTNAEFWMLNAGATIMPNGNSDNIRTGNPG